METGRLNRARDNMSAKIPFLIVMTIASLLFSPLTRALGFELHDNNSDRLNAVLASGTIRWDDVERLDNFLAGLPSKRNTAIYLNSPGGSLGGGIRLGKYFRQNRIKTVVEGNETCASACALAFLGGTDRGGNRWMSSTTTSRLGFHAYRNADGTRYEDIENVQQIVASILQYGQLVDAPMEIFVRNFQTPANQMYWFSTHELLDLGIKVWDMTNECFVGTQGC
jgi:Predicted periplasmic protein